jgi:hypothetical protein
MPSLRHHQSVQFTKMLLIGDSGTGKTGSLVSLVKAGYKLRILDLDNGLDILRNLVLEQCPELIDNVHFITVTDKFKQVGGKAVPVDSNAWPRAVKYLDNWTNFGEIRKEVGADGKPVNVQIKADDPEHFNLGKPETWGADTILVLDSFTFMCNAAMRYILKLNGRPAGPTYESDWNEAQQLVENLLAMLYDVSMRTNIIVCAHIAVRTEKDGTTTAYPTALGKALGPKVGRYFNAMLEVRRSGVGSTLRRTINTVPAGLLELKNPNPLKVKSSYDISVGLAEYFKAVRGEDLTAQPPVHLHAAKA